MRTAAKNDLAAPRRLGVGMLALVLLSAPAAMGCGMLAGYNSWGDKSGWERSGDACPDEGYGSSYSRRRGRGYR